MSISAGWKSRLTATKHFQNNAKFTVKESSLIGKIGRFTLQILGSSPSALVVLVVPYMIRIKLA